MFIKTQARPGMTRRYDDLDTPDTAPGKCPECGQPANIWEAVSQHWECSLCNWKGRNPILYPTTDETR